MLGDRINVSYLKIRVKNLILERGSKMQRTLDELKKECKIRGVFLEENSEKKYSRKDLIDKLAAFSIVQPGFSLSWGLKTRLEVESPMLCFSYKNLKEKEQREVLGSPEKWVAEEKWNGCRCIITYHLDEGLRFFSRNISVKDFLPEEFTEKVLLIKDGKVRKPGEVREFKGSFVLDSEVIVDRKDINTGGLTTKGVVTGSELNACSAILALNKESSERVQIEQASLKFKIFDILYARGIRITGEKLATRLKILEKLTESPWYQSLPFYESEKRSEKIQEFYQEVVDRGGEGLVLKNLNSPYIGTSSRLRTGFIKYKRTMSGAWGDVDVFISGATPSDEGKAWGEYIGAVKVSVVLRDGEGEEDYWIGSISGIPLELRKKMTVKDEEGGVKLNPQYLGKVLRVDGQSISSRNHRFSHCRCEDWTFREDKTKYDCVLDKELLIMEVR